MVAFFRYIFSCAVLEVAVFSLPTLCLKSSNKSGFIPNLNANEIHLTTTSSRLQPWPCLGGPHPHPPSWSMPHSHTHHPAQTLGQTHESTGLSHSPGDLGSGFWVLGPGPSPRSECVFFWVGIYIYASSLNGYKMRCFGEICSIH